MTRWTTLREVLIPLTKRSPLQQGWSPQCERSSAPPGEWGVLKTTAIQPGHFDDSANKLLPPTLVPKPELAVQAGDLLLTCAGPRSRCGVPALVRQTRPKLMISGKMYRFRTVPHMDPRFLEAYLLSPNAQQSIDEMKTGINESGLNLTKDRFLRLEVPVPSVAEQRRIMEALEGHLSRLGAANEYLLRAQSHLRRFRAARDDQLVWGQNASRKPIGMLLGEPMRNGHSARALSGDGPGVRTLTLTAITRRSFTDTYTKITAANPDRIQDLWLKPGDVLVQRANTPELVGTSALYEGPEGWAIFPDLAIRLRANQAIIRPRYLALALQANKTHTALRGKAKGLAGSMPKIDQRAVAECEIPVPSLSAQDRILREAEGVHEVTDQLQREVVKSLKRSANLRRALLSAAFSGRSPADTEMGRFFIDGPSEQEVLAG